MKTFLHKNNLKYFIRISMVLSIAISILWLVFLVSFLGNKYHIMGISLYITIVLLSAAAIVSAFQLKIWKAEQLSKQFLILTVLNTAPIPFLSFIALIGYIYFFIYKKDDFDDISENAEFSEKNNDIINTEQDQLISEKISNDDDVQSINEDIPNEDGDEDLDADGDMIF